MPNTDPNLMPQPAGVEYDLSSVQITTDERCAAPRDFTFTSADRGDYLALSAHRIASDGGDVTVTGTLAPEQVDALISFLLEMRQRDHMEHCTANSCCLAQAHAREN